jgi:hypothetical protein
VETLEGRGLGDLSLWQLDKAKYSARLCACAVLQFNDCVNRISGYLGTVKLVKYPASKNDKGGGNGNGRTRENRQTTKAD